jgi:hypothetical protein
VAFVLFGCAPKFTRPEGVTEQQQAQDEYECAMAVRDPAPQVVVTPPPTYSYPYGQPPRQVPDGTASGYALGRGIHVRSLYKACMRARGYR